YPAARELKPLASRPPEEFIARLKRHGVGAISVGRVIVATWEPHQTALLEAIHEMALELQVIFNKGAVMVLPSRVIAIGAAGPPVRPCHTTVRTVPYTAVRDVWANTARTTKEDRDRGSRHSRAQHAALSNGPDATGHGQYRQR